VLLARDPAGHVAVDNPHAVVGLLGALRAAGAGEQVTVLLARDPAGQAALDDERQVDWLLDALRSEDAEEQVSILIDRLPAAGLFDLFCKQDGHQVIYRFGREPGGTPAPPWDWDDLN
jgi:hypothetical protein